LIVFPGSLDRTVCVFCPTFRCFVLHPLGFSFFFSGFFTPCPCSPGRPLFPRVSSFLSLDATLYPSVSHISFLCPSTVTPGAHPPCFNFPDCSAPFYPIRVFFLCPCGLAPSNTFSRLFPFRIELLFHSADLPTVGLSWFLRLTIYLPFVFFRCFVFDDCFSVCAGLAPPLLLILSLPKRLSQMGL